MHYGTFVQHFILHSLWTNLMDDDTYLALYRWNTFLNLTYLLSRMFSSPKWSDFSNISCKGQTCHYEVKWWIIPHEKKGKCSLSVHLFQMHCDITLHDLNCEPSMLAPEALLLSLDLFSHTSQISLAMKTFHLTDHKVYSSFTCNVKKKKTGNRETLFICECLIMSIFEGK